MLPLEQIKEDILHNNNRYFYLTWLAAILFGGLLLIEIVARLQPLLADGDIELQSSRNHVAKIIADNKSVSVQDLLKWSLFGEAQQKATPVKSSKMKVVGIFMSTDPDKAIAVFENEKGVESLYMKGDKIPGGGVIKNILKDKVIFYYNGKIRSLELSMDEFHASNSMKLLFLLMEESIASAKKRERHNQENFS